MSDSISAPQPVYADAPAPASYSPPLGFVEPGPLSTVIVDSIAADTVPGRLPHFIAVEKADSLRAEALAEAFPPIAVAEVPSGSCEGLPPMALRPNYQHSTSLVALMVGILVIVATNAGSVARALRSYRAELWNVRGRANLFDDEHSVRTPTAVLLALVFVVFGGIVLYNLPSLPVAPSFAGAATSMALVGAYYAFQRCAYGLVGYAFATPDENKRWIGGFNATQAYAGLAMALPAILMVCRPDWHSILLIISITAYEALHLLFIIKGLRIFYHKISSLLYFILYLCTLEIIPQIAICRLSSFLASMA